MQYATASRRCVYSVLIAPGPGVEGLGIKHSLRGCLVVRLNRGEPKVQTELPCWLVEKWQEEQQHQHVPGN